MPSIERQLIQQLNQHPDGPLLQLLPELNCKGRDKLTLGRVGVDALYRGRALKGVWEGEALLVVAGRAAAAVAQVTGGEQANQMRQSITTLQAAVDEEVKIGQLYSGSAREVCRIHFMCGGVHVLERWGSPPLVTVTESYPRSIQST